MIDPAIDPKRKTIICSMELINNLKQLVKDVTEDRRDDYENIIDHCEACIEGISAEK